MEHRTVYDNLPLDSSSKQVRLLHLQAGRKGHQLQGRLVRASLGSAGPYEALSYTWGLSQEAKTIDLETDSLAITDNLAAALETLRYPQKARTLWIDAISIDQSNLKERSEQVQLMRQVYCLASQVTVWINHRISPTSPGVERLRALSEDSVKSDLGEVGIWDELRPLWKDDYWNRVWIQQEISSASSLLFRFGETEISGHRLFHLFRLFKDRRDDIDLNSPAWYDWAWNDPNFQLPPRFGEHDPTLGDRKGSTFADDDLDLLPILSRSYKLKCTDDRDRIYGLLHLANDVSEADILVDYRLSLPQVFIAVAQFVLERYKSLDSLLYAGSIRKKEQNQTSISTIPSWTPDWRRAPNFMWGTEVVCKQWVLPDHLQSSINPTAGVLKTFGIRLASISAVIDLPTGMDLYNTTALRFAEICTAITGTAASLQANTSSPDGTSQLDSIWFVLLKALVNLDNFFIDDEQKYSKFRDLMIGSAERFKESFQEDQEPENVSAIEDVTIANILASNTPLQNDLGRTWIRMMDNVISRHAPFIGSGGRIGMAPRHAAMTDEAWIVLGCKKVLILRPVGLRYEVIGEGYLEGWNRSEWVTSLTKDSRVGDEVNGKTIEPLELC